MLREPDEWLRSRFGPAVAQLVADLRQLMRLSELTRTQGDGGGKLHGLDDQAEALRRMLLAMANDLRVVLLRLASRLQTLRYYAAEKHPGAEAFARETMSLYAPLANRLGIWQVKWELEDLAFRFLEPGTYKQVARLLEEKRAEREAFIANALERVRTMMNDAGIHGEVSGRPKHIYSIVSKMRTKNLAFEQLYDVRGLRVIVDEVAQCYQVLSLVHQAWSADRQRVRRLHRAAEAQRVPVPAHRGGGRGGATARDPDPHPRHARVRRARHRRALALQGRHQGARHRRAARRMAAAAAGLARRSRAAAAGHRRPA